MGLSDLIAGGMDATAATELLLNVVWTIVGATLVYFMQAGFAMCEAGFTRAKNTGNILMKNMMDFVLGSCSFSSSDLRSCTEPTGMVSSV